MALGYIAYRVVKKVKQSLSLGQGQAPRSPQTQEPDTLVQDPVCGTFIPRRNALKTSRDGKEYFFCCEGCLKGFLRQSDKYVKS
jgi:YHS domain-containing protein